MGLLHGFHNTCYGGIEGGGEAAQDFKAWKPHPEFDLRDVSWVKAGAFRKFLLGEAVALPQHPDPCAETFPLFFHIAAPFWKAGDRSSLPVSHFYYF